MDDLLPYYERELAFLRRDSREFAERYPKIAARLLLNGEGCDDPHVERMIESFALLSARVSKRLEDAYPQFTEALLGVLYPHYLRPFPSCSIACFDISGAEAQLSNALTLPRGTELNTRPVKGVQCRFRTAWAVDLLPVRVAALQFEPIARAPQGVTLPVGCSAVLSITLESLGQEGGWAAHAGRALRIFIDAEPSVAAALRDTLFIRVGKAFASAADGRWLGAQASPVGEVGFASNEALIDFPDNAHEAYRHLTEYFAFPEKYNFFDLRLADLPAAALSGGRVTVHLALRDLRADSDTARLLQTLEAANLRLGCVPVVNLFAQRGDPIRITHQRTAYPVVADGRRAFAYEVYAIDAVQRVRQTAQGESITEFRPFFSLYHGESPEREGHYWHLQRNEAVARHSPGYETEISIVDADFDLWQPKNDILSVQLTCTNRELPSYLSVGLPGGDLFTEGGTPARVISLLRKPTRPHRFEHGRNGQWRLISHLALNQLSLSGSGVQAFREMLTLYDLPRSPISRRQIDGVHAIDQRPATVWLPGNPFASFVRGLEVRLTVDEESLVGTGIDVFARVVDRFLGLYAHLNSFVQLVLVSKQSGEELIRCAPRAGESILG